MRLFTIGFTKKSAAVSMYTARSTRPRKNSWMATRKSSFHGTATPRYTAGSWKSEAAARTSFPDSPDSRTSVCSAVKHLPNGVTAVLPQRSSPSAAALLLPPTCKARPAAGAPFSFATYKRPGITFQGVL